MQLIVGVALDANTTTVQLQRFSRKKGGRWKPVGEVFDGRLGANGLAWGRGLNPQEPMPAGLAAKHEGDRRSPAGVFALGTAFGYARDVTRRPSQPYVQVTPYDLFVEDPTSPAYNTHVRLDHLPSSEWERGQQMEQSDPSHALEVVINHNTQPSVVPGAGSAILFHIWRRAGVATTTGCTAMSEAQLRSIVAWIDPLLEPMYVLLPQQVYATLAPSWGLPTLTVPWLTPTRPRSAGE